MSFHSSLIFYRKTPPPTITYTILGNFLARLEGTRIYRPMASRWNALKVSFGAAIDQDDEQKLGLRLHRKGSVSWVQLQQEKWDLVRESRSDEDRLSHAQIVSTLKNYRHGFLRRVRRTPETLYRAQCQLGTVTNSIWQSVVAVPENVGHHPLRLDSWSLDLGPVLLFPDPAHEAANEIEALQVGWIGLRLSGQGSRGVQTPAQIVDRAEVQPAIQAMMQLCRHFWPVEPAPVSAQVIAGRRLLGPCWPYARHDQPWDWYWGFRES